MKKRVVLTISTCASLNIVLRYVGNVVKQRVSDEIHAYWYSPFCSGRLFVNSRRRFPLHARRRGIPFWCTQQDNILPGNPLLVSLFETGWHGESLDLEFCLILSNAREHIHLVPCVLLICIFIIAGFVTNTLKFAKLALLWMLMFGLWYLYIHCPRSPTFDTGLVTYDINTN